MQRRAAADRAHHLHARAFAVGALDVDDLVALAHRQVHRLVRQLVQFAHRAERRVAHVEPGLDEVAELEQAHAQAVAAGFGPVDEAAGRQVVEDAVRGRRVQPGAFADFLQRDRVLVRGQHVEQAEGALEHLDGGGRASFRVIGDPPNAAILHGENGCVASGSCRRRPSARRPRRCAAMRTAPSSVAG